MKQKYKYFPTQSESEDVFLLLRKHWFAYVPVAGIALFMSIPLLFAFYYWFYSVENGASELLAASIVIFSSVYALFILGLLLFCFIDYYLDVDIITNQRIVDIEQNGLFKRKISEANLDQVEDVSAIVHGFFPTLLHFGDVHVQTAGNKANFDFKTIGHPYKITKIVSELHEAALRQQALKKHGPESGNKDRIDQMAVGSDRLKRTSTVPPTFEAIREEIASEVPRQTHLHESEKKTILSGLEKDKDIIESK